MSENLTSDPSETDQLTAELTVPDSPLVPPSPSGGKLHTTKIDPSIIERFRRTFGDASPGHHSALPPLELQPSMLNRGRSSNQVQPARATTTSTTNYVESSNLTSAVVGDRPSSPGLNPSRSWRGESPLLSPSTKHMREDLPLPRPASGEKKFNNSWTSKFTRRIIVALLLANLFFLLLLWLIVLLALLGVFPIDSRISAAITTLGIRPTSMTLEHLRVTHSVSTIDADFQASGPLLVDKLSIEGAAITSRDGSTIALVGNVTVAGGVTTNAGVTASGDIYSSGTVRGSKGSFGATTLTGDLTGQNANFAGNLQALQGSISASSLFIGNNPLRSVMYSTATFSPGIINNGMQTIVELSIPAGRLITHMIHFHLILRRMAGVSGTGIITQISFAGQNVTNLAINTSSPQELVVILGARDSGSTCWAFLKTSNSGANGMNYGEISDIDLTVPQPFTLQGDPGAAGQQWRSEGYFMEQIPVLT